LKNDDGKAIKSNEMEAINGVPQSSNLGPLLFNLYVNDLPVYLKEKAEVIMYADDCALIISENDAQSLNDVLKSIDMWFCANLYLAFPVLLP